jgi:hypothetical protein
VPPVEFGHYFVDPPLIVDDDARVRRGGCVPSIAWVGRHFHEAMNASCRRSISDQVFELARCLLSFAIVALASLWMRGHGAEPRFAGEHHERRATTRLLHPLRSSAWEQDIFARAPPTLDGGRPIESVGSRPIVFQLTDPFRELYGLRFKIIHFLA